MLLAIIIFFGVNLTVLGFLWLVSLVVAGLRMVKLP
jgi:hypothetical protein